MEFYLDFFQKKINNKQKVQILLKNQMQILKIDKIIFHSISYIYFY